MAILLYHIVTHSVRCITAKFGVKIQLLELPMVFQISGKCGCMYRLVTVTMLVQVVGLELQEVAVLRPVLHRKKLLQRPYLRVYFLSKRADGAKSMEE